MNFIDFITIFNTTIWLLIPIRQYRTKYFLFFLILALFDPIFLGFYYCFSISINNFYLIGTSILTIGAYPNLNKKNRVLISSIFVLITIFTAIFFKELHRENELVVHLFILLNFLSILVKDFSVTRQLTFFMIVLISYEISLIVKFYLVLDTQVAIGAAYFYITTMLQIIIGIFFLFINEKNSKSISFN